MPLKDLLTQHRAFLIQFLRFGIVGTLGFIWNNAVLYPLAPLIGPYYAEFVAYLVASSMNWLLNRIWTYRHLDHSAAHRQLVAFLLANSVGLSLNLGTYSVLVATVPFCRAHLILPNAAGAIAGMFVNFYLSRLLVFR